MALSHRKVGAFRRHELADVIEFDLLFGRETSEYSCVGDRSLPAEGAIIGGFRRSGRDAWAAAWPTKIDADGYVRAWECVLRRSRPLAEAARSAGLRGVAA